MSKYSADLVEIGVAKEATRGTMVSPTFGWKWSDLSVVDKTVMAVDESRSGVLEDSRNSYVAGQYAEGDIAGPVRDDLIGLILLAAFGTVADSLVQTGVYDHAYSVAETNNHQSISIHKKDPNGGHDHALAMLDSLEILVSPDKINTFKAGFRSKARASTALGDFTVTIAAPAVATLTAHGLSTGDAIQLTTTGALPTGLATATTYYVIKVDANTFNFATTLANALGGTKITTTGTQSGTHSATLVNRYIAYSTSHNTFLGKHTTFKLASTQSGLGAASAINVRSAKLSIKQSVEDDRTIGNVDPIDIVNRKYEVSLEIEIVMTADTYITALLAGTSYAGRLDMQRTDVTIGASSNPRVYFDTYKMILQEASPKYKVGDLTMQTLSFKAHYSESDAAMIVATVRNTTASY